MLQERNTAQMKEEFALFKMLLRLGFFVFLLFNKEKKKQSLVFQRQDEIK